MGAGFLHPFLDESYGADHYSMAAVVVDDLEYRKLCDGLDRVASTAHEQFNLDPDVEFHAHDIMQGRKSWECFSGQVHEAVALYRAAARAVRESGALLTIEGVHEPEPSRSGRADRAARTILREFGSLQDRK